MKGFFLLCQRASDTSFVLGSNQGCHGHNVKYYHYTNETISYELSPPPLMVLHGTSKVSVDTLPLSLMAPSFPQLNWRRGNRMLLSLSMVSCVQFITYHPVSDRTRTGDHRPFSGQAFYQLNYGYITPMAGIEPTTNTLRAYRSTI